MNVTPFHCGPFANQSERTAFEHLKSRIQSSLGAGDDEWLLLTNLTWAVMHQFQADEIDLIAVGPAGVRVIEVKHWSRRWIDDHADLVTLEADRVTNKAKKIGTSCRNAVPDLGHVDGVVLLTRKSPDTKELAGRIVRGVRFCTLKEWRKALNFDAPPTLRPQQVRRLGRLLEPKSAVAVDGSLRRFAGYVNLERRTPPKERFHRVYRGVHATRADKVIVHLYDLSASDEAHAETRAKREFETLRRLQRHAWAPRVLDSWQPAPGYAGEMHFFTITDPLAPSVEKRTRDSSWDAPARLAFARAALGALGEMHGETLDDAPILHRNLTPQTVLVRHDNTPIFTGFELSKLPSELSVASTGPPAGEWPPSTAPEVRARGLHAADARSDRYALCASLRVLFEGRNDETSRQALEVLASGMEDEAAQRSEPSALDARFSALLGESAPPPAPPPARFWTEDQIVPFHGGEYRVIERLGSGGVGTAFKVVQIDRRGKNEGTYVAKVCHDEEAGRRAMSAYRLARSHLQHQAVSGILEVASAWRENEFTALMTWVDGSPLRGYAGVLPLLADDLSESSAEALALSWLRTMCEALDVLHRNGLVHGDVSPANLIVSGGDLVLTDYDFVGRVGEPIAAPGAALYCSPSHEAVRAASPSDDLYALAASFFHVLFDCAPFRGNGAPAKEHGLNWEAVDAEQRSEYPTVARFLERATEPDADRRFQSATEALTVLVPEPSVSPSPAPFPSVESGTKPGQESKPPVPLSPAPVRREERVEWLKGLLQSYSVTGWKMDFRQWNCGRIARAVVKVSTAATSRFAHDTHHFVDFLTTTPVYIAFLRFSRQVYTSFRRFSRHDPGNRRPRNDRGGAAGRPPAGGLFAKGPSAGEAVSVPGGPPGAPHGKRGRRPGTVRICIHRGTREIGGTCIEIEAQGKRIVLDVGLPLDAPARRSHEALLPPVAGFQDADDSLLAVVISHPHVDHYGLARYVHRDVPVYLGKGAHNIMKAARPWMRNGYAFAESPHFIADRTPVRIGPFRITPHLVDHSAFDAYSLLVEADGKRMYYSGDFRAHGRKKALFDRMVADPPKDIDVLLMEGTTVGRAETGGKYPTEGDLEGKFVSAFRKTEGIHFVWTSSQNIDRLVTIFRAAKRTLRALVIDLYTAAILEATGRNTIPQSHWDGVKLYVPHQQRVFIKNNKLFDVLRRHARNRIYPKELPRLGGRAVMLFRPMAMDDRGVQAAIEGARFTYSMWQGYLKADSSQRVVQWLETNGIPWESIHTSGHASVADLQRFAAALAPRSLVPIHFFETGRFAEFFDNVDRKEDGVSWDVA